MNRRFKIAGIGLGLVFQVLLIMPFLQAQELESNVVKYGRLLQLIDGYYVDTANISRLTETAIVEVLGKLDPHSVYISKDEVEKMNEPLEGSFEGIGISFNILRDTLIVVSTIPGGPSEKVGLMAGDRIMYINDKPVAGVGLKNSDVTDKLRGEKGTRVRLKVLRGNDTDLLDFTIIRDKIPINSLDAAYMLNDNTGYIKLNRFSATTTEEFTKAIKNLKKTANLENLVLDLRGNGGGYMKAAIELADHFLGANRLVVFTEGLNDRRKDYKASAHGEFEQGRVVILIDEGSASASEIVAGAIQDWDRGVIIGRRSYGKGLVQQPFPLTDGSMVRLTTAHYYTPSGRGIQKPYDKGVDEYRKDYIKRLEHGELFSKDSIHFDKTRIHYTLKNKRTVYGGGGVMPDIFVPVDTSSNFRYYNLLVRNNILYSVAVDYVVSNRSELAKKYKYFKDFIGNFEISDELIEKMIIEADKAKIEKSEESISFARPYIRKQVKAFVARDLFGNDQYYQVLNHNEPIIKQAIQVLEKPEDYEKILVEK